MKNLPRYSICVGLGSAVLALLLSCSSDAPLLCIPSSHESYEDYVAKTTEFVSQNRRFSSEDRQTELKYNSPYEVKPEHPNGRGILLIHGLGDSPWTFRDIANRLAKEGYLVRVVLLPGHGTKPQDMIGVSSESWEKLIAEQMALLKKDVPQVWIGGFSTGGNLAYEYANKDGSVRGVVLFSPAVELKSSLIKLAPLVNKFVTWLLSPDEKTGGVLPFRYTTVPMDAIVSFKHTMDAADDILSKARYDKPSIVMLSEHDSIVDTKSLIDRFDKQLTSPESVIIWYGNQPEKSLSNKVVSKPDYIPKERIQSFAHMSLTYSPDNEWYGRQGKYRFCRNSMSEEDYNKCMTDKEIWYGAWGAKHGNKISARLTFNPYFDWQMQKILDTLEAGAIKPDAYGIIEIVEPVEKSSK